jgi:hypothetical protein
MNPYPRKKSGCLTAIIVTILILMSLAAAKSMMVEVLKGGGTSPE